MSWHKFAGSNWSIEELGAGKVSAQDAQLCVLMDIRHELRRLNLIVQCPNTADIPSILRRIDVNTRKAPRRKAKKGKKR